MTTERRAGRLSLAIVGGRRGAAFRRPAAALGEAVALVAVCDPDEAVLARWRAEAPPAERGAAPVLRTYSTYEALLEQADVDAVLLASPMELHATQAIQALAAGKHVLSEVIAATTIEEGWALVEAVERSDRTYMMAENCTFLRETLLVRQMVQRGVFGELTYAEGGYIHDTRDLSFRRDDPAGALAWRGQLRRDLDGNTYPTHALGPVAQWIGAATAGATDRFTELCTWTSREVSRTRYAASRFGATHPQAQPGSWAGGDTSTTLIRTARGVLVTLRHDSASARPAMNTHYALQGATASYVAGRHRGETPLVWIEGVSPGSSPGDAAWQPLWDYAGEYEHPLWRARGGAAAATEINRGGRGGRGGQVGHGDTDFLTLDAFVSALRTGSPAAVDVYDAVTWSSVMPLSIASVAQGGAPVPIPDFRRRANEQ